MYSNTATLSKRPSSKLPVESVSSGWLTVVLYVSCPRSVRTICQRQMGQKLHSHDDSRQFSAAGQPCWIAKAERHPRSAKHSRCRETCSTDTPETAPRFSS